MRALLPPTAPEHGQSFASLLEDIDRVILPGVTHWQSPRFFAYFSTTGSAPGVLAELITAALNNVGILWRASPALQELEETVMAWLAGLLGLPAGWHGHLEEGASLSTLAALAAAREARPGARVVVCSEHAHSSVDKACRVLELELRKVPADAEFRLRPDLLDLTGRLRGRRDRRHDVQHLGRPGRPHRGVVRARGRVAARRRRLRGLGDDLPRAALGLRGHRARRLARRQPAQVAAHAAGLLGALDAPPRGLPRRLRARAGVPAHARRGRELQRVQPRARPPVPRAQALGRAPPLRRRGPARARAREHSPGPGVRELGRSREPGWELCAPRPFSVVCFRLDASDEENAALLARVNATGEIFISHTKLNGRYVMRLAIGNEHTTLDDVRRAWDVIRATAAAR